MWEIKKEHNAFCQVGIVTLNREKRVWARHVIINILTHAFLSSVGRYNTIHFCSTHEDTEAQDTLPVAKGDTGE